MIKKHLWLLLFLLAGCGLGHEEGEHLEPLDPAAWPTAPAISAAASATPFPKATLSLPIEAAPATTQVETPTAAASPDALPATPTPSPAAPSPGLGSADLTAALVSRALNQFSVVATGITTAPDLSIRQGPGVNYGAVTPIETGSVFGILGKNGAGDWLYVIDASLMPGWLPISGLRVVGPLDRAPTLPPNPIAALVSGATTSPPTNSPPAEVTTSTISNLTPVTTAQVDHDGLNMRQGPGANYERIATLARNDKVTVLGLNPRQDWALVETSDQQRGWVALSYLALAGPVAGAPVIPADQFHQASQVSLPAPAPGAAPGNLAALATAKIVHDPVQVRPGPGSDFAAIDSLRLSDEVIPVLAVDQSGQWALVQPTSAQPGWVALTDLAVEGSLENAPRIYTAWVESNGVEVRQGPAIFHNVVGSLSIRSLVQVLGLDQSRSWALVKPIPSGEAAWAPINFLNIGSGGWQEIPPAPEMPLPSPPAAQAAPDTSFTPTRPVEESKIVFQRASGGDIMVINPDGTGLRRLTHGIDPMLSPDGQTVAFTRWEGETGSLWLIDVDGSNERSVQGFIKQAKGPDWSPDGAQIVLNFQSGGRLEEKTECFGLDEDSQPPQPPRNATDFKVSFGSDGPQLCWQLPPDPHWGLRVINLADGAFEDVDGGTYAFRPAWDPGQAWRIISDGGRGLVELDVNRDYRQTITGELNDGSPVFSPDGRFLAVTMGQQGGGPGHDIYRLNADGTGRVRLTQTPLWETALPGNDKAWNHVAPAWSPDGSQIAFLTDRTGRWEIWVMNADGANPQPLFSEEINDQLEISYNFVDERVLSWR